MCVCVCVSLREWWPPLAGRPLSKVALKTKHRLKKKLFKKKGQKTNHPNRFHRFKTLETPFTGFYWVLLGFTGFPNPFQPFPLVQNTRDVFYRVLLGLTGFYWLLPDFGLLHETTGGLFTYRQKIGKTR